MGVFGTNPFDWLSIRYRPVILPLATGQVPALTMYVDDAGNVYVDGSGNVVVNGVGSAETAALYLHRYI